MAQKTNVDHKIIVRFKSIDDDDFKYIVYAHCTTPRTRHRYMKAARLTGISDGRHETCEHQTPIIFFFPSSEELEH